MKPVRLLPNSYSTHYIFYNDSPMKYSLTCTLTTETRVLFLTFAADIFLCLNTDFDFQAASPIVSPPSIHF